VVDTKAKMSPELKREMLMRVDKARAVMRNLFLTLARAHWKMGQEKTLVEYVESNFHKMDKQDQDLVVTQLIKTICEREH
jgi:hypothetical protein